MQYQAGVAGRRRRLHRPLLLASGAGHRRTDDPISTEVHARPPTERRNKLAA